MIFDINLIYKNKTRLNMNGISFLSEIKLTRSENGVASATYLRMMCCFQSMLETGSIQHACIDI